MFIGYARLTSRLKSANTELCFPHKLFPPSEPYPIKLEVMTPTLTIYSFVAANKASAVALYTSSNPKNPVLILFILWMKFYHQGEEFHNGNVSGLIYGSKSLNRRYRKRKLPARCATPSSGPRKSTGVPKVLYLDIERESNLAPRIPDFLKKWALLQVGHTYHESLAYGTDIVARKNLKTCANNLEVCGFENRNLPISWYQ